MSSSSTPLHLPGSTWADLPTVNWPLRDDARHASITLACCAGLGGLMGVLSGSWWMALLSGVAIAAPFWKLWLPVSCEFGPQGITVGVLGRRRLVEWREIDHIELGGRGVFIGGEPREAPFSALRRIYLPWPSEPETALEGYRRYCSRVDPRDSTATWHRPPDDGEA